MNRKQRSQIAAVERSRLCWEIRELARQFGRFQASPTFLLRTLNERAAPANKLQIWPQNANQLGIELRRFEEGLKLKGVSISYSRNGIYGGRLWHLWWCKDARPFGDNRKTDLEAMHRAGYVRRVNRKQ
jgi:hypothetical protein